MPDADLPGLDPLSAPQPNPALQALAFLLGAWEMVLSNASFLPDQTTSVKGQLMVDWMQQGAYMIMLMGNPATPDARWLISRDGDAASYTMSYYDARQVARIYQMTYVDHVWKIWRDHPTFSQRFTAKVSADERVIAGHWEKSADGQTWERDFDVTYTKQRP